ncbi:hypothetical protein CH252_02020 [Rhodococcus sp. 06-1477-1B]|uniref:hypothetical protein n=1 Tax=Rhodococcus sp. 06-1474-1B TaxID=2022499 RepID=UPI000B9B5B55|nr:hypothetical protein [Rhodococcus sp. 06-1474-1B]OZD44377.1 hypothetical protein CH266_24405 [Rhodococcus sp. 06-1474-1B]OZD58672.1 hypothetical protein CH252_02020 [Rhodococcus sp. 06-1477-1B]
MFLRQMYAAGAAGFMGSLNKASTLPYIGPVFVHSLRDAGTDSDSDSDSEQNFGLLRADFTRQPAFDVVRGRSAAIPAPLWGLCRGIPAAEPSSGAFCAIEAVAVGPEDALHTSR